MSLLTNVTEHAAAHFVGRNRDGRLFFTCVVKAEYGWRPDGGVAPAPAEAVRREDELAADADGPGAAVSLVRPSELGPRKRRVDVLLVGAIVARSPVEALDVSVTVGSRLRKTLRVFGDRVWLPSARGDVQPSRPRAFTRMPIAWDRSFGGIDPASPAHAELRNPAGVGLGTTADAMAGMRLPNFEDSRSLITSWKSRPAPVGFGPVAAHWLPRSRLAGTFDQRWNDSRRPLLPEDFDPAFYNVAP